MEFFEIKYLTAFPGVWIRPHTADNNQVMKIHLGLQNPGRKFYMRAGNDTVHWIPGKAHLFDDSFLHEVNSTSVEVRPCVAVARCAHRPSHSPAGVALLPFGPGRRPTRRARHQVYASGSASYARSRHFYEHATVARETRHGRWWRQRANGHRDTCAAHDEPADREARCARW